MTRLGVGVALACSHDVTDGARLLNMQRATVDCASWQRGTFRRAWRYDKATIWFLCKFREDALDVGGIAHACP
jgi:hypothetical protein